MNREAIIGCILETTVGDALGRTFPFCATHQINARLIAARSANDAGTADIATLSNGELQPVQKPALLNNLSILCHPSN